MPKLTWLLSPLKKYIYIYKSTMGKNKPEGCSCKSQPGFYISIAEKNLRSSAGPAHAKAKLACVCFLQVAHNGEAQGLMVQKPMWIVCILKSEDLSFMGLGCAGFM